MNLIDMTPAELAPLLAPYFADDAPMTRDALTDDLNDLLHNSSLDEFLPAARDMNDTDFDALTTRLLDDDDFDIITPLLALINS